MIEALVYLAGVALFIATFVLTGMPKSFGQVVEQARETSSVLTNPELDDLAKEKAAQSGALGLLKIGTIITVKGAATLAMTLLPFWLADITGIGSWEETTAFALRWDVLLITTVVTIAIWMLWRRRVSSGN